jgi:hypothetical protein
MTESYFLKSNDLDLSLDEFDKESYENLPIDEYHKNSLKLLEYILSPKNYLPQDNENANLFNFLPNEEENKSDKNEKIFVSDTKNTSDIKDKKIIIDIKNTSEKDENNGNEKMDGLSPNLKANLDLHPRKFFRVDDAKKHFKVAISKYATQVINNLIQNSDLPKGLKKKIHLPNFKAFTSNVREFDNYKFLSFDLKTVFTHGKTDENLQGCNDKIISKILKYKKYPEKLQKMKDFLSLKYKDIIKQFYKSDNFKEFKENDLTKFFDDGIKKEKNISLLEEDGLVKLFEMTNKKRKRDLFSINLMI